MQSSPESDGRRGRAPEIGAPNGRDASNDREGEEPFLSDDDMFEVLYNQRRRRVIEHLRDRDGPIAVGDLAEYIATEEGDTTLDRLSSYDRKRVYVSLYQNHLPLMDDVGVVDYDADRKTVRLLDTATKLEPYLEDGTGRGATRALSAVALLVAVSVLLGSLQVGTLGVAPVSAWAALGVSGLVGVAALEAYMTAVE